MESVLTDKLMDLKKENKSLKYKIEILEDQIKILKIEKEDDGNRKIEILNEMLKRATKRTTKREHLKILKNAGDLIKNAGDLIKKWEDLKKDYEDLKKDYEDQK